MTILEAIGAFTLFFVIVAVVMTQFGVMKWTVERTDE